jgi:acyl-CoA thioester hydrolase
MSGPTRKQKPTPKTRAAFRYFAPFETRWRDNDQYGHINNAIYYELFDSAINQLLLSNKILDFDNGDTVFLVAASGCDYFSELAYPDTVEVGLAIAHLGTSAVTYDLGLFKTSAEKTAATGFFVHVHVARDGYRPLPISAATRQVFEPLMVTG